jgi:hypothetical protein
LTTFVAWHVVRTNPGLLFTDCLCRLYVDDQENDNHETDEDFDPDDDAAPIDDDDEYDDEEDDDGDDDNDDDEDDSYHPDPNHNPAADIDVDPVDPAQEDGKETADPDAGVVEEEVVEEGGVEEEHGKR